MSMKNQIKEGLIFHVFNKSISNYRIFKNDINAERFIKLLDYYNNLEKKLSYSVYIRKVNDCFPTLLIPKNNSLLKFIAYCIMPDHYHLLIKALVDNKISKYISDVENSYTRYFNIKFNRKGPLWQSRFKSVKIRNNEQLIHVSRYIHLNPTTSNFVLNPEDWPYSSYKEYVCNKEVLRKIVKEISISDPKIYKKFVDDQKDYQRKLKEIKKLIIE